MIWILGRIRAEVSTDPKFREPLVIKGKLPVSVLKVTVEEVHSPAEQGTDSGVAMGLESPEQSVILSDS